MKLFKNKKGFTLVELLISIGVIAALVAITYVYMSKKQIIASAENQVREILQMDESLQQMMVQVPNTPSGVTKIIEILTPAKVIEAGMAPKGRVAGTDIRSTFKAGTITFSSEYMNISSINTQMVPVYTYNITQVPSAACAFIASSPDLQSFVRINIDGVTVKNPGEIVSPSKVAGACAGNINKTIQISQSSVLNKMEYGTLVVNLAGTSGHLRDTENPFHQEQLRTTTNTGTCSGGSWNSNLSFCSCPIGTEWTGKKCAAFGEPGICPTGQGWDIPTNVCKPLTKAPFANNTAIYENGRYIPQFMANSTSMPLNQGFFQCQGPLPPNATPPSNGAGNYDGSICNKCINGTWNGSRCVLDPID